MTTYGQCITIAPTQLSDSEETIRASVSFSMVLPPPGYTVDNSNEQLEIAHLKATLGWKDPRGLFGYSETSEYKDLYIYFDYGDKTSPVNEIATKAFKMYGLGGAMVSEKPSWGKIRGSVYILRLKPDMSFSPNAVYSPVFTVDEIYRTLVFFRDAETSAYKIAQMRDATRTMNIFGMDTGMRLPSVYFGPNSSEKLKDDVEAKCDHCGKPKTMVGKLKQCARCQTALYCSKDCQKAAWKSHKKTCKNL